MKDKSTVELKTCHRCYINKPLSDFGNDRKTKDGLSLWCRDCVSVQCKQYREEHKEELKNKRDKNYKINKISINKKQREKRKLSPWAFTLYDIRKRCNNPNSEFYYCYGGRGIRCQITSNELKELWFRDKTYEMKQPSIDRIDNDGDYTFNNCRYLELGKNTIKAHIIPILQFDKNDTFIKEWDSIINAAKSLSISDGDIVNCLKKKKYHKSAGGFVWRYKNG